MPFSNLNIFLAFGAGVVSFLSPCILALVPAYLGFISGTNVEEMSKADPKLRVKVFWNTLLFILGFSIVFLLLGFSSSFLGKLFFQYRFALSRIVGGLVIILGFYLLGLIKIPFFSTEKRFQIKRYKHAGSFLFGLTFGLGWTPCVSIVLGSILLLAATTGSAIYGIALLGAYSLGLAIPFLLVALLLSSAFLAIKNIGPYLKYIQGVAGILVIVIGILLLTGGLFQFNNFLFKIFQKYDLGIF